MSHLVTGVVAALAAVGAMMLAEPASPDPLSQASFPCAEDEVLAYSPQFGPERVGCIHYQEVLNNEHR